ncbi:MAG: metal ABC transporter permease [Nitrosomonadaceae bacterium]
MLQIIQILGLPFLACTLMSSILGYLGTHVLKREVIFVDIALAQIAAVGSIAAHMVFESHDGSPAAYLCSFGCIILAAGFYAFIRSRSIQISLEAVIGISYAIAAAAVLFLVGIASGGHVHIQNILSGSLLWVNLPQIFTCFVVFASVGFCFYLIRKPMSKISNSYNNGSDRGLRGVLWDFIFYILLGVVITLSVQIGGIVVVFSYLIIPATISAIFSLRSRLQFAIVWISGIIASLGGLLFAYHLDFSIGPSIAMFLGCELIIIGLIHRLQQKKG